MKPFSRLSAAASTAKPIRLIAGTLVAIGAVNLLRGMHYADLILRVLGESPPGTHTPATLLPVAAFGALPPIGIGVLLVIVGVTLWRGRSWARVAVAGCLGVEGLSLLVTTNWTRDVRDVMVMMLLVGAEVYLLLAKEVAPAAGDRKAEAWKSWLTIASFAGFLVLRAIGQAVFGGQVGLIL